MFNISLYRIFAIHKKIYQIQNILDKLWLKLEKNILFYTATPTISRGSPLSVLPLSKQTSPGPLFSQFSRCHTPSLRKRVIDYDRPFKYDYMWGTVSFWYNLTSVVVGFFCLFSPSFFQSNFALKNQWLLTSLCPDFNYVEKALYARLVSCQ